MHVYIYIYTHAYIYIHIHPNIYIYMLLYGVYKIFLFVENKYIGVFLYLHTAIPHFLLLHFISLHRWCIFGKLKVCSNPMWSKSILQFFLTACAHFMSLYRNLLILAIFPSIHYYYIWYDDLYSVIFDVLIVIVLCNHKLYFYKMMNLIQQSPISFSSLPSFETQILKLGKLIKKWGFCTKKEYCKCEG
jgi:hypothetical protein